MARLPDVPAPRPGEVIRYAYLWSQEQSYGREEATKDRPCAVVLALQEKDGDTVVVVLPITSRRPALAEDAVELPSGTRQRLGLQDERCWLVLTEANRFVWPGPDLRPVERPHGAFYCHGLLPAGLFRTVRDRVVQRARQRMHRTVTRTG